MLEKIIGTDNHVCRLEPSPEGVVLRKIGWKKASTFPGFCAKHDSRTFAKLEQSQFSGTHEQCVLQAYRSTCNELYKKRALIESLQYQRHVVDRGCDLNTQINKQLSVATNIEGQQKSAEENEAFRQQFDDAIRENDLERFASKCYFFEGDLCVTSSSTLHAEFDFQGKKLMDMWDLEIDAEMLAHSTLATERGGAIIFVWLKNQQLPAHVVESFNAISDDEKGDIFVQYCFLNCENVYFSKEWWDNLPPSLQEQLKRYAISLYYEGGSFAANQNRLVRWALA